MADAQKMKKLIEDCERDIAACLHPESGIPERHLLQQLLSRLDGQQAKEALGDDWQRRWHDPGGDDDMSPSPTLRWTEPEFFGTIWRLKI
ncbi:hypothetical protein KEM44_04930 (plasmid) [Sinorhizobium meliloti]|uniref:hypothetical protein n=1 Tax=Rhizobium meliloti TaxID=382 RepID=UPI0018DFA165|nr:hypothetical protein [Sinorhizobium meliloti]MCK3784944.1 hypothetical protein [Sinorhizobium meliloti]MCK3791069.1 hypothetical protein [Sinorhizobium meliloti]MCK3797802.1 hypothetical protein [Sinorhizobium meliloti]UTG94713.1 hypothetical protein KEM44_04930 [Sinorhizobium meliloti]